MRDATNKILEMIDEGLLDARAVAQMCLKYMSEDAVADMANRGFARPRFTCSRQ